MGTTGPTSSVRYTPLSIWRPRYAFRKRDTQFAANFVRSFVWPNNAVCIADSPELFRVTQMLGGDVIETLAFGDRVFQKQLKPLRRRNNSTAHIDDAFAVRRFNRYGCDAVVAVGDREHIDLTGFWLCQAR